MSQYLWVLMFIVTVLSDFSRCESDVSAALGSKYRGAVLKNSKLS